MTTAGATVAEVAGVLRALGVRVHIVPSDSESPWEGINVWRNRDMRYPLTTVWAPNAESHGWTCGAAYGGDAPADWDAKAVAAKVCETLNLYA
jgi:hypothetical protein